MFGNVKGWIISALLLLTKPLSMVRFNGGLFAFRGSAPALQPSAPSSISSSGL